VIETKYFFLKTTKRKNKQTGKRFGKKKKKGKVQVQCIVVEIADLFDM